MFLWTKLSFMESIASFDFLKRIVPWIRGVFLSSIMIVVSPVPWLI